MAVIGKQKRKNGKKSSYYILHRENPILRKSLGSINLLIPSVHKFKIARRNLNLWTLDAFVPNKVVNWAIKLFKHHMVF